MWVKVKFSAFRTICGINFILWKRVIFFYMGFFRGRGMWLLKKIEKFITLIKRLVDELLSNDIYSLPKTTSVSFTFHLFCFEANINIQFPELHHPSTDTYCSIIQFFFHYFCLILFVGWPTSVLPFHVYF
jgi:hypothetical protein